MVAVMMDDVKLDATADISTDRASDCSTDSAASLPGRRDCLSVFHEGDMEGYLFDGRPFLVGSGRTGAWARYKGELHAVWGDFRYGWTDPDVLISLADGSDVPVPGSWGARPVRFVRLDVCSRRSLSAVYQMARRRDGSLGDRLCGAFDFVAHHIVRGNSWSGDYHNVLLVRGCDYEGIDWGEVESAFFDGLPLPAEVVCYGSATTVEDFLVDRTPGGWDEPVSRRWRVDIRRPRLWSEWFCRRHKKVDIYGSDWVNPNDVVVAAQDLVMPYDSDNGTGIVVGIRVDNGRPVLTVIAEYDNRTPLSMARAYFGPEAAVSPVYGDEAVFGVLDEFQRVGLDVAFAGSLDFDRFSRKVGD